MALMEYNFKYFLTTVGKKVRNRSIKIFVCRGVIPEISHIGVETSYAVLKSLRRLSVGKIKPFR